MGRVVIYKCCSYTMQLTNSKMRDSFTCLVLFSYQLHSASSIHTCFFFVFFLAPSRQFTPVYVCTRTPNRPECVIKFNQPYAVSSMRFVVMYKMVFTMLHSSISGYHGNLGTILYVLPIYECWYQVHHTLVNTLQVHCARGWGNWQGQRVLQSREWYLSHNSWPGLDVSPYSYDN